MIRALRRSFAAKVIAGGCILALVVVSGVAGYLIFSRTTQTRAAAQSNADNRVGVMAQVLQRFTGAESLSAAASLAGQPLLQAALASPDPATAVRALFERGASVDLSGEVLLVSDRSGRLLDALASPSVAALPSVTATPEAIGTALARGKCQRSDGGPTPGGCGIEILSGGDPAYVVALPVLANGTVVGAVAYAAPLAYQLVRFQALFGFPTAFIAAQRTDHELRPNLGGASTTDPALRAMLAQVAKAPTSTSSTYSAIYDAPLTGGGSGSVAGSFVPVRAAGGGLTGFMGVEVPVSQFAGDERTDILVLALISIFLLLFVALVLVLFVDRFVKRPIARLERGVARIAGGDYATDIAVRSEDELGRLAANVNRMRDSIAGYVGEIEEARERLDTALERVSGVSRALTTTTAGVAGLQAAVVRTAAAIGGGPASSVLAMRSGDSLVATASAGAAPPLDDWVGLEAVLSGETVRLDHPEHGALVAVPMFYQESVVGALAVVTPRFAAAVRSDVDVDVLAVLANNATIAMENARLFEQERQTVQRLLELDSLKTDFLSTVQHELRTPLTAILGLSDLLDMYWAKWGDEPKLEAVHDIQVAAKNLYDIVETIIDYSAMEGAQLGLNPGMVPLRAAFATVLELVAERYKGGLPVPVDVQSDEDISVFADADRLIQVLRAIVDNAMKFSDGRGRVTVAFAPVNRGRRVRIEIADQGVGIPADDMPRIFDRFYQVDNTATRRYGGTGMGLALVKRMVHAHGATVEVSSSVGEGTKVVLVWPTTSASASGEAREVSDGRGDKPRPRPSPPPAVPVQ
ncbi:MAG TPA: ATP-binding protein [Candidatus Dormibacteraeota bacterium]|nr:ATP-binding protein [Candidatus Dormibacteraeota bacterium]